MTSTGIEQRDPPELTVVTGAAGWLGSALTTALATRPGVLRLNVMNAAEGDHVATLAPDAEIVVGDLLDTVTIRRLLDDAANADVIHTAGIIHPRVIADFESVNVGGTVAVVTAARASGVRRLVHVSSNSPFGCNPTPDDVFHAEEPYHPYMAYGRTKMRAEQVIRAAHGDTLETTIVRPPWFYGRHQPERQSRFFAAIRAGRFPLVGDGGNRRSMVHVSNLTQGVLRAELAPIAAGRAYWIADRRPYTMREIVETVRHALEREGFSVNRRMPRLPRLTSTIAERLDRELQRRGRYVAELHVLGEMDKTIACEITAARDELGYKPQIGLLEGMRDAIRWSVERGAPL